MWRHLPIRNAAAGPAARSYYDAHELLKSPSQVRPIVIIKEYYLVLIFEITVQKIVTRTTKKSNLWR